MQATQYSSQKLKWKIQSVSFVQIDRNKMQLIVNTSENPLWGILKLHAIAIRY